MATGSRDCKVILWRPVYGARRCVFSGSRECVTGIQFLSLHGRSFIFSSRSGDLMCVDSVGRAVFRILRLSCPCAFVCLSVSRGSHLMFTGLDLFPGVLGWNVYNLQLAFVFRDHVSPLSCLSFDMWRFVLATGSWDCTARVRFLGRELGHLESYVHTCEVVCLTFKPSFCLLVVSLIDCCICI